MTDEARLTIYGAHWCPDCRRCKSFLGEHGVPYHWVDILEHPDVTAEIVKKTGGQSVLPTIIFDDGDVLTRPTNLELARKLDLEINMQRKFWPLIVIGSGPAGLTASLFAMRDSTDTLVIEREFIGGNANFTGYLENVPGFPEPVTGFDFSNRLREQAEHFGVEILQAANIERIRSESNYHTLVTTDGHEYNCNAVVVATGSHYRQLSIPGEEEFNGKGVHFCASCDGPFYKGQHVAVVGGGNSAVEAALDLAAYANRVSVVVRGGELTANTVTQGKMFEQDNIAVRYRSTPLEFSGRSRLRSMRLRNDETGEEETLRVSGAFVFIGLEPNTGFLKGGDIALDDWGFVRTGHSLLKEEGGTTRFNGRLPLMLETSVPGVFAAGDVREGSTKQVATAAGEGAAVAMLVREYLRGVEFSI